MLKRIGYPCLAILLVLALAACSAPAVTPTPSPIPYITLGPDAMNPTEGMVPEVIAPVLSMTGTESAALSKKANVAVAQLSEIATCVTAIVGDSCLCAVTFDPQYAGGLTDRVRDMVEARVQSVSPSVTRVMVTVDAAITAEISNLSGKLASLKAVSEALMDFDGLVGKVM